MSQLYLITGPRESGKTTWCTDLMQRAIEGELSLGGFLSPAILKDGKKIGIDLLDLQSGQQRPLARKQSENPDSIMIGEWHFDSENLKCANKVLELTSFPDVLILDELGPLEFERGEGFVEGLRLIDAAADA